MRLYVKERNQQYLVRMAIQYPLPWQIMGATIKRFALIRACAQRSAFLHGQFAFTLYNNLISCSHSCIGVLKIIADCNICVTFVHCLNSSFFCSSKVGSVTR